MVEMIFNDDTQGNETPDEALRELLQQIQQPMLRSRKQGIFRRESSREFGATEGGPAEKKAEPF